MKHKYLFYTLLGICLLLLGCQDELRTPDDTDDVNLLGEAVQFTTQWVSTSAVETKSFDATNYKPATQLPGPLTVTMKSSDSDTGTSCDYTLQTSGEGGDGTLKPADGQTPLCWTGGQYGFEATAGTETLEADQSTPEKWQQQDRLQGYAADPKNDEEGTMTCRTWKEWYTATKAWVGTTGMPTVDDCKKVPLFLRHQRAMISLILKAGDGVEREALDFATADQKIATRLYSYSGESTLEITPLLCKENVTYGESETREGVRYTAIVEPYNYLAAAETKPLCKINLSNQNFSFYASNDNQYNNYKQSEESAQATHAMQMYNLKAGQHLVITATLSRSSRKIVITAYVEDWTDVVTAYMSDDFGNNGDPILIATRQELIDFLKDNKKNAAGNMAIINATTLDLTQEKSGETVTDTPWCPESYTLKATLNLGGCHLTTNAPLVEKIESSGRVLNGTVTAKIMNGSYPTTLICTDNYGAVEHLQIEKAAGATGDTYVTRAAVAVSNYGSITYCTSSLPVVGTAESGAMAEAPTYIGGIAARSLYDSNLESAPIPTISHCTVTGRVGLANSETNVRGGGIVGKVAGQLSANTYEFGVTLLQNTSATIYMKNIAYAEDETEGKGLKEDAYSGNEWPTSTTNKTVKGSGDGAVIENARTAEDLFTNVIDCSEELKMLIGAGSSHNVKDNRYRIAADFTVCDADWPAQVSDELESSIAGNVLFTLEGNDKTITLDGATDAPMLFTNIVGEVRNLTIHCAKPIRAYSTTEEASTINQHVSAPLAYAVVGGTVSQITVTAAAEAKAEAALAGGVVVWAYKNATLKGCRSNLPIAIHTDGTIGDLKLYSGGIVAQAAIATLSQCEYVPAVGYHVSSTISTSQSIYFGGIVGGVVIKSSANESPKIVLEDNHSWYSPGTGIVQGALIGRACYSPSGAATDINGVDSNACQGNWWPEGNIKAVGESANHATDEQVVGKKNSIKPERPTL